MRTNYFILFFSFFIFQIGSAQLPTEYIPSHITYENGLAIGYTRNIIQDSTGLLWITGGRGIGLHTYDGKKVKTFHLDNPTRFFPLSQSYRAVEMQNRNIMISDWSSTLYIFNPYERRMVDSISQEAAQPNNIYDFTIDKKGTVWAVTMSYAEGDYVYLLKANKGEPMNVVQKIPINNYSQIIAYKEKIFVTGDEAIYVFDQEGTPVKICALEDGSKNVSPYGFTVDSEGKLWLKTAHQKEEKNRSFALFKFNEVNSEFDIFPLKNSQPLIDTENIESIGDDLWFFGVQETLWKVNLKTSEVVNYSDVLRSVTDKNFYILNVIKDASQQLWVTTSRGLIKLAPAKKAKFFMEIQKQDGFCEDNCYVQSITATDTAIYFSYLYSVVAQSKQTKQFYSLDNNLENTSKGAMIESIWDEGANKLSVHNNQLIWLDQLIDLNTLESVDLIPQQNDYRVVNSPIGDHTLWLAPYYPAQKEEQLFEYNFKTNQLRNISPDLDLPSEDYPLQILESKLYDKVWVAYEFRGILEFTKSGKYIRKYQDDSILDNNCLYEDKKGNLWVGTKQGLTKINIQNDGELQHFKNRTYNYQGREKNVEIRSIAPTDENTLWLGGRIGIYRFDLNTEKYDTPDLPRELKEVECMFTASYINADGTIYFGTKNGIVYFHPNDVLSGSSFQSDFPIAINQISTFNNEEEKENTIHSTLADLKKIELSPQDLWFSLEYFIPFYQDSDKTLYSHKLEGYDSDWSLPSVDNFLKYTNLPHGEYTLHLQAGHDSGKVGQYQRSIQIIVHQAWYKSFWFRLISFLSIIGLIYSALQYRYKQKLEKRLAIEKLRNKISSDLHDDVGSILTGIAMQSEIMALGKNEEEQAPINELTNMSRDAMERMRDIVWAMDSRKDKYENLIDRMQDFAQRNLEPLGINYHFDLEKIDTSQSLNPNVRQQFYLIFKESIANIIKHSDANEVKISFAKNKNTIHLVIHDNGSEKPLNKSDGQGMSNMKKRAKDIGGEFYLTFEKGYKVHVEVI